MLDRISDSQTSKINKGLSDYLNSILEQYKGIYIQESLNPYRIEFKEYLKLGDDRDDTIGDLRGYNQAGYKAINLTNIESNALIKTILHEFVHDIEPYVLYNNSKLINPLRTKGSKTPLTEEQLKIGNQIENLRKIVIKHLANEFKNKKPNSLKNEIERLENGGLITIYGVAKKPTPVYIENLKNELKAVNKLIETNKVEEFIEGNKNIFLNNEYNHYGVTNLNEFITEALTSEKFRDLLNEIPYKNTTVLSYLFELFQKILGIKKDTVLSEALNLIHELATTKREQLRDASITPQQKQQAQQLYQSFLDSLNKPNTNPILQNNQEEQIKKFTELQERLNNKEFLEGAKSAYESTPDLQQLGAQEEYTDYIARVSLGIIKNPSSGEYNYTSQAKDILLHGSPETNLQTPNASFKRGFYATAYEEMAKGAGGSTNWDKVSKIYRLLVNAKNPRIELKPAAIADMERNPISYIKEQGYDSFIINNQSFKNNRPNEEVVVFESEQIHILGSQADIQGFKEFVDNKNIEELPGLDELPEPQCK